MTQVKRHHPRTEYQDAYDRYFDNHGTVEGFWYDVATIESEGSDARLVSSW